MKACAFSAQYHLFDVACPTARGLSVLISRKYAFVCASGPPLPFYNQPVSASVHAGRESSGNVTFLGVFAREKGAFCRVPCVKSPLVLPCRSARHSHDVVPHNVCNWLERQQSCVLMRLFGRQNRRSEIQKILLSPPFCSGESQHGELLVHLQVRR